MCGAKRAFNLGKQALGDTSVFLRLYHECGERVYHISSLRKFTRKSYKSSLFNEFALIIMGKVFLIFQIGYKISDRNLIFWKHQVLSDGGAQVVRVKTVVAVLACQAQCFPEASLCRLT